MKTQKYQICKICGGHNLPVIGCHCTEAVIRNLKIAQELVALGELELACGRIDAATDKIKKRAAAMPNIKAEPRATCGIRIYETRSE